MNRSRYELSFNNICHQLTETISRHDANFIIEILTIYGATGDNQVDILTALGFQCKLLVKLVPTFQIISNHQLFQNVIYEMDLFVQGSKF